MAFMAMFFVSGVAFAEDEQSKAPTLKSCQVANKDSRLCLLHVDYGRPLQQMVIDGMFKTVEEQIDLQKWSVVLEPEAPRLVAVGILRLTAKGMESLSIDGQGISSTIVRDWMAAHRLRPANLHELLAFRLAGSAWDPEPYSWLVALGFVATLNGADYVPLIDLAEGGWQLILSEDDYWDPDTRFLAVLEDQRTPGDVIREQLRKTLDSEVSTR